MYLWVADWVTPTHHPLLFGWLHAVWNVCMVLGSLIGGALVDINNGLPFVVTGLLNIASLALVTRLYRQAPSSHPVATA
jgi:MFS family permease